jgi:hypothetical protein
MSFTIDAGTMYQTVAASTTQACGPLGGHAGDYLGGVLIVPATTSPSDSAWRASLPVSRGV